MHSTVVLAEWELPTICCSKMMCVKFPIVIDRPTYRSEQQEREREKKVSGGGSWFASFDLFIYFIFLVGRINSLRNRKSLVGMPREIWQMTNWHISISKVHMIATIITWTSWWSAIITRKLVWYVGSRTFISVPVGTTSVLFGAGKWGAKTNGRVSRSRQQQKNIVMKKRTTKKKWAILHSSGWSYHERNDRVEILKTRTRTLLAAISKQANGIRRSALLAHRWLHELGFLIPVRKLCGTAFQLSASFDAHHTYVPYWIKIYICWSKSFFNEIRPFGRLLVILFVVLYTICARNCHTTR